MPRQSRGPRLWWRKERRKGSKVIARGAWIISDGGQHHATGCFVGEDREAQEFLAAYIAEKYSPERRLKDIESIDIADVLSVFDEDCRERQANKAKFDERMLRLAKWWGGKMLSDVNGASCRAYAKSRGSNGGSRRDLEDLRAAINHSKEGFHRGVVRVVLPEKGLPRERWLDRSEAAKLLWTCWRYRETQTVHIGPLKGQKINWACDWSFVLDPNTQQTEEGWTFIKFAIGPDGFKAAGTEGLALAKQDWERQQLPGEPIYAAPPPAYRPSREMMAKEFYSLLPERQKKMKDSEVDAAAWAQGCGNLGGLAASEIWTAMAAAWQNALTGQMTPEAALIQGQADVQKALDAFWEQLG
mgnify:CR=1 FL=1